MKLKAFLLLGSLVAAAHAADQTPRNMPPAPPPPALDTKEAPPPPAAPAAESPEGEPQVTITKHDGQTVEEYRVSGKLYMIKITPSHGKPYYLVDDLGDGKFARRESLDSGVRVPRWVIHSF